MASRWTATTGAFALTAALTFAGAGIGLASTASRGQHAQAAHRSGTHRKHAACRRGSRHHGAAYRHHRRRCTRVAFAHIALRHRHRGGTISTSSTTTQATTGAEVTAGTTSSTTTGTTTTVFTNATTVITNTTTTESTNTESRATESTTTGTSSTTTESSSTEPLGPTSSPGSSTGFDGFGGLSLPGANWRPYASSSPFNLTTEGVEVDPESAAIVKRVLSWGLPGNLVAGTAETSSDWSHPVYYAQPGDPIYTLHATESWGANSLDGMQIPIPQDAKPAGGSDGHMTVVTPDGWEYDFWRATTPTPGGGAYDFAWGGRTRIDGSGLESGATAADFGNLAGMIREPELAAGKINHALFIVLKCAAKGTSFGYGTTSSSTSSYVYPATHGGSTCPSEEAGTPPLGTHFMLAMSDAQIQALAVPTWKKTILTALAHYGGYVGDTGGSGFCLMFESSSSYTALGLPDPLVQFAKENGVPTWEGKYVFNLASGVEWEKYLRVLAPPANQ